MKLFQAFDYIEQAWKEQQALGVQVLVIFEDARKHRIMYGRNFSKGSKVLQGVGGVKAHCKLIEEWLQAKGIPYIAVRPGRSTKSKAEYFERVTLWSGRTNSHARDAAMLIHGYNLPIAQALLREALERKGRQRAARS